MNGNDEFFNLYNHNFVRVAVAIPEIRVADPAFNVAGTIDLIDRAAEAGALLVTFPELGLSAYSCDDLFHQHSLLEACLEALAKVLEASVKIPVIAVVGLPLQVDSLLFNCGAVIYRGRVLGIAPKSYLPNYREFYELRQFTPGDVAIRKSIDLLGQHDIPFG
ncbi:MAG TPA: nitrilase-related carbon-nitrogen hydrolase, partial [Geobacteraceae bacterium]|nr:nitrilase-related carbon-nitrogen hydrolase [Geobacteraceae bacterium]